MSTVGSYEAKTRLPELLRSVERGETVTITRRGVPIARIVGIDDRVQGFHGRHGIPGQPAHGTVARPAVPLHRPSAAGAAPVIYTGTSPWSAAPRVIDLVTPGASPIGLRDAGVASRADPLFAGDGYLTRDTLRVATEDLNLDNAASLHRRMNPPELRPLREVMLLWAQQVAKRRINLDLRMQDMVEVDRMRESDDVEAFFAARVEVWRNQYRAEGRAQGVEQGLAAESELLCRPAARHFDAGTAERLRALLDDVSDQEAFEEILAAIFERTTPAELLARTMQARRRAADRSPAGTG